MSAMVEVDVVADQVSLFVQRVENVWLGLRASRQMLSEVADGLDRLSREAMELAQYLETVRSQP